MSRTDNAPPDPLLIRSRYLDVVPLRDGNFVCVHSLERSRLVVRPEVVELLDSLQAPLRASSWLADFATRTGRPRPAIAQCVGEMLEAGFLFAGTAEEEETKYSALASELFSSEPGADRHLEERWSQRNMDRFAAVRVARDLESFTPLQRKASALLIGFCDVQFGSDILRDEARRARIELQLTTTFEMDLEAAAEKSFDVIIVGALAARHGSWYRSDGEGDLAPRRYLASARRITESLRSRSTAPILINNLPLPSVTAAGLADQHDGSSVVDRARAINDGLLEMARGIADVHVVDLDALLSYHGKRRLLDDRLVPFSHLGGLGWWTRLPPHELRGVYGQPLPIDLQKGYDVAEPFEYDRLVALEHLRWIRTLLGVGRRKCVLVDLDNTLWPGVLAETGSPFPLDLDFTLFSYHSIYVGLHQALRALLSRGILLAGLSKNDEKVVQALWKYPPSAPSDLLGPEDFVTQRINWSEKSDNIVAIAAELKLPLDAFVVIDDNPVERDKIRARLPEVLVLGDDFSTLRSELLTMPELQVLAITDEAKKRTETTRALVQRERLRETTESPEEYLASLQLRCEIERVRDERELDRIHELVARTNQFNTTTQRLTRSALARAIRDDSLYTLRASDRFTEYGLVGVALVRQRRIELMLLSCRVIGLGFESALLGAIARDAGAGPLVGLFHPTDRNTPARNIFRDHGFEERGNGEWIVQDASFVTGITRTMQVALNGIVSG